MPGIRPGAVAATGRGTPLGKEPGASGTTGRRERIRSGADLRLSARADFSRLEFPLMKRESPRARAERELLPGVCAATGAGDRPRLKRYVKTALEKGIPLRHIEEAILQCYLFAGFPAALEGLLVLRDTAGGRGRRRRPAKTSEREIIERGLRLCEKVYGDKYEALKKRSIELHPEIWEWMIREGYGKVLSRPPLDSRLRELCVVATLVVTGWERQLRSHVHGALNVGCPPGAVIHTVRTAGRIAGDWVAKWALRIAREEIARAQATRESTGGRRE